MEQERRLGGAASLLAAGLLLAIGLLIIGRGGAAAGPRAAAILLLGAALTGASVLARFLPAPFQARPGPVGSLLLGILALAALGVPRAFYPHAALTALPIWAGAGAACAIALVTGSDRRTNERIRAGLSLLGAAAALPAFLPSLNDWLPWGGLFTNRNHTAALLAATFPMALAGVIFAGPRRLASGAAICSGVSAFLCATGVLLTGSRGGLVAALAGLAVLVFLGVRQSSVRFPDQRGRAAWALAIIGIALCLSIYSGATGLARFRPAETRSESSAGLRLSIWQSSIAAAWDGGPLGWGIGSYRWVYPAYRGFDIPYRVDHAHNDWLEHTVELGWAFPFLALGIVWSLGRRAIGICREHPDRVAIGSAVGGFSGLAALGVHALIDSPLQTAPLLWLGGALAGLVTVPVKMERRGRSIVAPMRRGWVNTAATGACVLATVTLSLAPLRQAQSEAAIARAGIALEALSMEAAITQAREAVADDPDSAQAHATLGRILVAARESGVGGRAALKEAQAAFARAAALNPRDTNAHLDLARTAAARGDEAVAETAFETAAVLDPVSGRVLEGRARYLLRTGRPDEALVSLRASVAADSRGLSRVLPLLWEETGDPKLLRSVTPETAEAWTALGDFLEVCGHQAEADDAFRFAAVLDPKGQKPLLRRASLALRQHRPGDALRLAREAEKRGVRTAETGRFLAASLRAEGRFEAAAAVYDEVLHLDARDKPSARALAALSIEIGRPRMAVAGWQRVIRVLPGDLEARHQLARAHRAAGEWKEAVEVCLAVLDTASGDTPCRVEVIDIYLENGLTMQAKQILDPWIARTPDSVSARNALAAYFEASGRLIDARREYRRILELEPGNSAARTALARLRKRGDGGAS